MRTPIVLLLLLSSTACATLPSALRAGRPCRAASLDVAAVHAEARAHVVLVRTDRMVGTGFLLERGADVLVITNQHIVAGARAVEVDLPTADGPAATLAHVEIESVDSEEDLAVLRLPRVRERAGGLVLAPSAAVIGQPVLALGYPFVEGSSFTLTAERGDVTAAQRDVDGRTYVQTNANINHGNSGGPVLDACGQVVGVVVAMIRATERTGLVIPQARIQALVARSGRVEATTSDLATRAAAIGERLVRGAYEELDPMWSWAVVEETALPIVAQNTQLAAREITAARATLASKGVDLERLSEAERSATLARLLTAEGQYAIVIERKVAITGDPDAVGRELLTAALFHLVGAPTRYVLGKTQVRGDVAEVEMELEKGAERRSWNLVLRREGGEWYLDGAVPR